MMRQTTGKAEQRRKGRTTKRVYREKEPLRFDTLLDQGN